MSEGVTEDFVEPVVAEDAPEEAVPAEQVVAENAPEEAVPVEQAVAEDAPEEAVPVEQAVAEDAPEEAVPAEPVVAEDAAEEDLPAQADPALVNTVESLLFLSQDPLGAGELAEATLASEAHVIVALASLQDRHVEGASGLRVREVGGGFTLASAPESEDAARRLFSKPRVATLTPAQTETLAIVAYLQPISRPEIGRIRGVSADSATAALLERGLIEESGRSQFGAALYRTTNLFLKLFGINALADLPDVAKWDPTPEETAELRDRLLRAGDARSGGAPAQE